jgi:hypothetical protein
LRRVERRESRPGRLVTGELHFAVESTYGRVQVIITPAAEVRACLEHLRIQASHTVEDLGFDVVHLGVAGEIRQVGLSRTLLKLGEGPFDLSAVVSFSRVPGDRNPRTGYPDRVPHPRQRVFQRVRLFRERDERVRGGIAGEEVTQARQAPGPQGDARQFFGQRTDSPAVDLDSIQIPGFFLQLVMELGSSSEVLAHQPHGLRESSDRLRYLGTLKIAQNLLPVTHGRDLVQWREEERLQLVVLSPCRH